MAAGDLVVADFQIEVRATLMGPGSNYRLDYERLQAYTPMGQQSGKYVEVPLGSGDGSYGGVDRDGPLTFQFPLYFQGTAAAAGNAIKEMRTVWAKSSTDIPMYHQIPGTVGKFYVNGRPRPVGINAQFIEFGKVLFLCTFVALNPTITEV